MSQQNPLFEDNVNVSKTHPLADLAWLATFAILIIASLTAVLSVSIQWLAPLIPFEYEQKLVSSLNLIDDDLVTEHSSTQETQRLNYLQQLADELAIAQQLDPDINIKVHWVDDDVVNAFATLSGHIFITKGLWEMMPNENALAMVLAHEIAHIHHRDPIKGLSRGLVLSFIQSLLFGSNDSSSSLIGTTSLLTSLAFNRDMETEADNRAIATLYNHYGHTAEATRFFEQIVNQESVSFAFLQTHPLSQDRIDQLITLQQNNNWPQYHSAIIALPFK